MLIESYFFSDELFVIENGLCFVGLNFLGRTSTLLLRSQTRVALPHIDMKMAKKTVAPLSKILLAAT